MADLTNIGCCGCFSFLRKPSVPARQPPDDDGMLFEDLLEDQSAEDPDVSFYTGDDPGLSFYNGNNLDTSFLNGDDLDKSFYDRDDNDYLDESDTGPPMKSSQDIIQSRAQSGFACREIPVNETNKVFRSEDENCNKMVNQYVHLGKIGSGSYGKVVLNKPYMLKVHVVRSETAMTDVLLEDDDDMLWRSPGTPVFTAPECCQVQVQHTMETYDKITNDPVQIPDDMNPQLADLLQRLLCKDPGERITLQTAAEHPLVAGDKGPVPEHICRCGFGRWKRSDLGNHL